MVNPLPFFPSHFDCDFFAVCWKKHSRFSHEIVLGSPASVEKFPNLITALKLHIQSNVETKLQASFIASASVETGCNYWLTFGKAACRRLIIAFIKVFTIAEERWPRLVMTTMTTKEGSLQEAFAFLRLPLYASSFVGPFCVAVALGRLVRCGSSVTQQWNGQHA